MMSYVQALRRTKSDLLSTLAANAGTYDGAAAELIEQLMSVNPCSRAMDCRDLLEGEWEVLNGMQGWTLLDALRSIASLDDPTALESAIR